MVVNPIGRISLLKYLSSGGWVVVQTLEKEIYLLNLSDFSDFGSKKSVIEEYATFADFIRFGVYAWQKMPFISFDMPPKNRKFLAAYNLLKNYPLARIELCKFEPYCFKYPLNNIVIAALAKGKKEKKHLYL